MCGAPFFVHAPFRLIDRRRFRPWNCHRRLQRQARRSVSQSRLYSDGPHRHVSRAHDSLYHGYGACHCDAAKHLRNSGAQRSTYPFGFGYPKWLAGLPNKSPGPVAGFE